MVQWKGRKLNKNEKIKEEEKQGTEKRKLPLSSDIVFKRVFSKEENKDLLKSILEAILKIKINKIEIKNPEIPREMKDSKAGVLDIKAEINENTVIEVEMQVSNMNTFMNRNEFYLVSTAANEMKIGNKYINVKKTITIALLCKNIIKRNSYFHTAHMKFEPYKKDTYINMGYKKEQDIATDKLEMIFIEIPKFIAKNPQEESLLNQWLWLIAGEEEKIKMAKEKHQEIEKAMEVIDEMSMDPKEWEIYESRRRAEIFYNWDMTAARQEGRKEGEKSGLKKRKKRTE